MKNEPDPPGLVYLTYAALTALAARPLHAWVAARMRKRGVSDARIGERFGKATAPRPAGRLLWFHAVSVGEAQSILGLITLLGERLPSASFLITTVTHTSAEIVASRLPPRTRHQFAPLDTPPAMKRFLNHWQPNLAVLVESEIWPRMIVKTERLGTPLILINARLSEKSFRVWRRIPGLPKTLLDRFSAIVAQTQGTVDGFLRLGADPEILSASGDLKAAAAPLPVDQSALDTLKQAVGARPVWIAASTHSGEEEILAAAHRLVLKDAPDALMILVPRHPERGDKVMEMLSSCGWRASRRSAAALPDADDQIYLADTLGEMGVFFALSQVLFLGGSFVPVGGHNPFEPAKFGIPVLHGPQVANAADTYAQMDKAGAAKLVHDANDLASAVADWLPGPPADRVEAAQRFAVAADEIQSQVADTILAVLESNP